MHRDPYPAASILADLASTSLAVSPPAPDPVAEPLGAVAGDVEFHGGAQSHVERRGIQ